MPVCVVSLQTAVAQQPNTQQSSPAGGPSVAGQTQLEQPGEQFQMLLTQLAREHIPHTYEDKKHWGMTDERWDGVHIHLDGLQLKTKRRKKTVNHGDWRMVRAEMVNPHEALFVRVENLHLTDDRRAAFDLEFKAPVLAHGRFAKWVKGVQLFALSADATADLTLRVSCVANATLDFQKLPPDLVFEAQVTDADIAMQNFDMKRIGRIHGDPAEQIGIWVREIMEDKIEEKKPKLVEKINKQIDKHKDKMRISLSEFLNTQWADFAKKNFPQLLSGGK